MKALDVWVGVRCPVLFATNKTRTPGEVKRMVPSWHHDHSHLDEARRLGYPMNRARPAWKGVELSDMGAVDSFLPV